MEKIDRGRSDPPGWVVKALEDAFESMRAPSLN